MDCIGKNITPCQGKLVENNCNKHYLQVRRHGKVFVTSRDKRPVIIEGNTAKIPLGLGAKDGYALVDRGFSYLANDNWRKTHYGYAVRSIDKKLLHHVIQPIEKGYVTDHIDGNTLNNLVSNLRVCSQADNSKNQAVKSNNTTGYKGVCYDKKLKKYVARVKSNYRYYSAGYFVDAVEAARAYNILAEKLHGEYARLNNV